MFAFNHPGKCVAPGHVHAVEAKGLAPSTRERGSQGGAPHYYHRRATATAAAPVVRKRLNGLARAREGAFWRVSGGARC